ncbi:MAG TPA: YceI family protein [Acidimicrobiia bacterium]|nr:YceI family protein [Acidimicrobiia bacterium]
MVRFTVDPDASGLTLATRSNVGPIDWSAAGLRGHVDVEVDGETLVVTQPVAAHLELEVETLRSGNALYDSELHRRIDARRFPLTTVDLQQVTPLPTSDRFEVRGELTFHGVTRVLSGTVTATVTDGRLHVAGEHVVDIRDYRVPSPTILMLRIFPDVRVQLDLVAVSDGNLG